MSIRNIALPHGLYPIVIQQSRYSGTYEGGAFFCYSGSFNLPDSFFEYLYGDDDAALDFWHSNDSVNFGVGDSPDDALYNFISKFSDNYDQDYKQLILAFEMRVRTESPKTVHVERTDYYQTSQPIFHPRKDKEF